MLKFQNSKNDESYSLLSVNRHVLLEVGLQGINVYCFSVNIFHGLVNATYDAILRKP